MTSVAIKRSDDMLKLNDGEMFVVMRNDFKTTCYDKVITKVRRYNKFIKKFSKKWESNRFVATNEWSSHYAEIHNLVYFMYTNYNGTLSENEKRLLSEMSLHPENFI